MIKPATVDRHVRRKEAGQLVLKSGPGAESLVSYGVARSMDQERTLDQEHTFVSLTEALHLTTPSGRAMTSMLAVFAEFEREILRDRVRAGIVRARKEGCRPG
jgi:resolvase-like protein